MLLWLLRVAYVTLVFGVAVFVFHHYYSEDPEGNGVFIGLGGALAVLALGGMVLFTDIKEKNKQITTISAIYFGLLLGLLLGWLVSFAVEPILQSLGGSTDPAKVSRLVVLGRMLVTVICCYISISTLLQT